MARKQAAKTTENADSMRATAVDRAIENLAVLIADGNPYTRRLTRSMLINLGMKATYEVGDGIATLEAIRSVKPDVMLLDWDLPVLSGCEIMQTIRTPGIFPRPNLPIIMLTDVAQRSRVHTALRVGAHELLVKPLSPKIIQQRLIGMILKPRPMVQAGRYYIPLPRRRADINELVRAT